MKQMCRCALALMLATTGGAQDVQPFQPTTEEDRLLRLVNLERKKHDLAPLTASALLFRVSRAHAANMARQGKMEHTLDGKTMADRVRAAGYPYAKAAENIAQADAEASLDLVLESWLKSKGHRDNLLSAEFTETGLGMAPDGSEKIYYAQLFARPRKAE